MILSYLLEVFPNIDRPQDDLFDSHHVSDQRLPLKLDFLLHVFLFFRVQRPDKRSYLNLTNEKIILSCRGGHK